MIYMDHAATGQPAPGVAEAVAQTLGGGFGNPGRSSHPAALAAARVQMDARQAVADLFGVADPNRILFTAGCTLAANMAIWGLNLRGGHVISSVLEHNAILRPLWRLSQRREISLTLLKPGEDGLISPRAIQKAMRHNTRLVALAHASNVTGLVQPLEAIGQITRQYKVPLLVDAAQTAGHMRYALDTQPFDLLVFCGHKGLRGPMGTGGLYVHPSCPLTAVLRGGTGVFSEILDPPDELPESFEAGTPNLPGLAGLAVAARHCQQHGAQYARTEAQLAQTLWEGLHQIPDIDVITGVTKSAGTVQRMPVISIAHRRLPPGELCLYLAGRDICARAGLHCAPLIHHAIGSPGGTLRLSLGPETTAEDIQAVLQALNAIENVKEDKITEPPNQAD